MNGGSRFLFTRRNVLGVAAALLLAAWWVRGTSASVAATGPSDAIAVADAIERLPVVGSVLLTGAHPDDENNALLTYLARGLHLRTAYLSATRGDGGQNLLGNEQYEGLGILRTEELMAARRIDGAEQFFAQAYDFGFSKDAGETLEKWGHENVLRDYVRVIRQFRPDVIISRFTGTPADGHGHHQASGMLTKEAFTAAADPTQFPELGSEGLEPWQAKWLFINRGGRGGSGGADSFAITLGGFSPVYGEEYGDLGAKARSQHRSQGMGQAGDGGPYTTTFVLAASADPNAPPPRELFAGLDLTLNRFAILSGNAPRVVERISEIEEQIEAARSAFSPYDPPKVLPSLVQGLALLRELRAEVSSWSTPQGDKNLANLWLQRKESDFERAIVLAGGAVVEATVESAEIVPGGQFEVTVAGKVHEADAMQVGEIRLDGPSDWKIEQTGPTAMGAEEGGVEAKFQITVPPEAPVAQPYWLVNERTNDAFSVEPGPLAGSPHQPALLTATWELSVALPSGLVGLELTADVVHRYADRVYGEREDPLAVLPVLGVWLEPGVAVFPQGSRSTRAFLARVRNNTATQQTGTLRLALPSGWQASPASASFTLEEQGAEASIRFEVTPPAASRTASERHTIQAVAEAAGKSYSTGYTVIDYPHVTKRYWFEPAEATVERFDVKVAPGLRVGYIMGSGDEIPNGIKQLGVEVTELTGDDLSFGDLSRFDVIVTGIRAYEVRRDVSANHDRLMEFVRNGGLMIVQYTRPGGFSDILPPYPMRMNSGLRVAVEQAPVEILEPDHPLFSFPNKIVNDDFNGWVQERGTYFMESWAPEYTPLLASNDPGEPLQEGGMLLARYGDGYYLYTGYAWFRQLPAGVQGAYRIFANMLSLGKSPTQP
jgi:LmbE family N-acetylglucosaminyl deacetylase